MSKKPIENGDIDGLVSIDSKLIVRAILENKAVLLNILNSSFGSIFVPDEDGKQIVKMQVKNGKLDIQYEDEGGE